MSIATGVAVGLPWGQAPRWTPNRWTSADVLEAVTSRDVLVAGGLVTTMFGQYGVADATAALVVDQGAYVATHPAFKNRPAVHLASSYYAWNPLALASSNWTWLFVYENLAPNILRFLLDFSGGRCLYAPGSLVPDSEYFDGVGFFGVGAAPVGAASDAVVSAGASVYMSRSNVPNAPVVVVPRNIGGTGAIGSNFTGAPSSQMTNCYLAEVYILRRTATVADLDNWFGWTLAYYGA